MKEKPQMLDFCNNAVRSNAAKSATRDIKEEMLKQAGKLFYGQKTAQVQFILQETHYN